MGRTKKIIEIILAVVLLVGGGVWIWKGKLEFQKEPQKEGKVLVTPPADLKVESYSLGGQVISVDEGAGRIVFNAYIFYRNGNEEGIKSEQEPRSAIITKDTKFSKMTQNDKEGTRVIDASIGDLKVGMNIVVYSSKNLVTNLETIATRVEISP